MGFIHTCSHHVHRISWKCCVFLHPERSEFFSSCKEKSCTNLFSPAFKRHGSPAQHFFYSQVWAGLVSQSVSGVRLNGAGVVRMAGSVSQQQESLMQSSRPPRGSSAESSETKRLCRARSTESVSLLHHVGMIVRGHAEITHTQRECSRVSDHWQDLHCWMLTSVIILPQRHLRVVCVCLMVVFSDL